MSGSVEERLQRALAQQAESTTTSPEGWQRVRTAIDGGEGRRRRLSLPWLVLAPAMAVIAIMALVVTLADGGGNRSLHVTGDSGRLYLAPTGVEPRFHLDRASDGGPGDALPPSTYRAFGRRAADGFTVEGSVVITMPGDRAMSGTKPEPTPLRALGRDLPVAGNPFGQRSVSWTQADGRTVGVITFGVSQAELAGVVESLLPGDAAVVVPVLPAGFGPLKSGAIAGAPPVTFQNWETGDGARFSVAVAEGSDSTVDDLAWWLPGSRARTVRDTTAAYLARDELFLTWIERPGTMVTLQARGLSEQELIAIAEGLRPIDAAAWRELTSWRGPPPFDPMAVPDIGPPPGVVRNPNAYFLIVPVRGTSAPPCAPIQMMTMAQKAGGREVACYQIAKPYVYADDVDTAVAREDGATGRWAVNYTLTPRGVTRMEELFRDVGVGGQAAIVVDGAVVSAPRFEARPAARGSVTDLDESTARSLADRLQR